MIVEFRTYLAPDRTSDEAWSQDRILTIGEEMKNAFCFISCPNLYFWILAELHQLGNSRFSETFLWRDPASLHCGPASRLATFVRSFPYRRELAACHPQILLFCIYPWELLGSWPPAADAASISWHKREIIREKWWNLGRNTCHTRSMVGHIERSQVK